MNYPSYAVDVSSTYSAFEFVSSGVNGDIPNLIKYTLVEEDKGLPAIYNLSFGVKENEDKINDAITTNNGDTALILTTVAKSAYVFSEANNNEFIFFKGSTESRTRLYQRAINKFFEILIEDWHILGLIDNQWVPFERNVNYEAFLVKRKQKQ